MLELWINGRLSGYWKCPKGFRDAKEFAAYYNERQRNLFDSFACKARVRAL